MTNVLTIAGSNRTFMELKSTEGKGEDKSEQVLIVPLWNWNQRTLSWLNTPACSNRTFMELKYELITKLRDDLAF